MIIIKFTTPGIVAAGGCYVYVTPRASAAHDCSRAFEDEPARFPLQHMPQPIQFRCALVAVATLMTEVHALGWRTVNKMPQKAADGGQNAAAYGSHVFMCSWVNPWRWMR